MNPIEFEEFKKMVETQIVIAFKLGMIDGLTIKNLDTVPALKERGDYIIAMAENLIKEEIKRTEKAFGGCVRCYGKGYSTVRRGRSYRKNGVYATHEIRKETIYCICDRGKQLNQIINGEKDNHAR